MDRTPDYLREMSDQELMAVISEIEERYEMFSSEVRMRVNDEARRRRVGLIRRSRHA